MTVPPARREGSHVHNFWWCPLVRERWGSEKYWRGVGQAGENRNRKYRWKQRRWSPGLQSTEGTRMRGLPKGRTGHCQPPWGQYSQPNWGSGSQTAGDKEWVGEEKVEVTGLILSRTLVVRREIRYQLKIVTKKRDVLGRQMGPNK